MIYYDEYNDLKSLHNINSIIFIRNNTICIVDYNNYSLQKEIPVAFIQKIYQR